MNQNYKKILQVIEKAGLIANELQGDLEIHQKSDGVDISTQVDHKIEEMLFKAVKQLFPNDGFWGEENEKLRNDQEYIWYVDPIDGTKFFAAEIPLWSVAIARVKNGEKIPEFSAIYVPKEGNLYYAAKGEGAYLNSSKIETKKQTVINKITLAFDFSPTKDKKLNAYVYKRAPKVLESFYRVRVLGCGTLSTVWTATGFFGCFIKYLQGTKQFNDVAAGLLIAQESGLHVEFETLKNDLDRIIICDKKILPKVIELIN